MRIANCNVVGCEEHKRRHTRKHSKDSFIIPEWLHFNALFAIVRFSLADFLILTYHFMVVEEKTTRKSFVRIQFM